MDTTTQLALRAIIRGLYHSDAINDQQVRAIISALKDAGGAAMERVEPDITKELVALCRGIHADTAVI